MQINFDIEQVAHNAVDIDDIGHCCIRATNDNLEDYYIIIRTTLGKSLIFTYGPIIPDLQLLPDEVKCNIKTVDFEMNKIVNIIRVFLNDPKKHIKYADIFTLEDCLSSCRDLIEYTRNYEVMYGKETN